MGKHDAELDDNKLIERPQERDLHSHRNPFMSIIYPNALKSLLMRQQRLCGRIVLAVIQWLLMLGRRFLSKQGN